MTFRVVALKRARFNNLQLDLVWKKDPLDSFKHMIGKIILMNAELFADNERQAPAAEAERGFDWLAVRRRTDGTKGELKLAVN